LGGRAGGHLFVLVLPENEGLSVEKPVIYTCYNCYVIVIIIIVIIIIIIIIILVITFMKGIYN